jgi:hypothetical protein
MPRRSFLVAMDLVRASVALALPFVTEVWQIYILMFLLQSASAAFTPTFQATIPDMLPEERDYTRALSLSHLAYDLENLLSPTLAAALLTVISFNELFAGTVIGFLCSALLMVSVRLPSTTAKGEVGQSFYENTTKGLRISDHAAPAWAACTEPVGCRGRRHGDREHGCAGTRGAGASGQRRRGGARLLRRRFDAGGAGASAVARSIAGSRSDDFRSRLVDGFIAGPRLVPTFLGM